MSWTVLFLCVYLLLQLAVGYWISRRIHSEEDYFLAGRSLGFGFASLSIFATWFGAETCMGSAGSIFEKGLSGSRADPFGYTICLLLMATFLAAPLRKLKLVTVGDLFGLRYSKSIEKLAVLILIPSTVIWSAAQVRALGQIVTVITPLDFSTACVLAAIFVIIYTSMGGLMGDVIHDVIQSVVLIIGLTLILYYSVSHVGGLEKAWAGIDPARFSFVGEGESFWQRLDAWMVPILGSLVAQELISRILACRDEKIAVRSSLTASGIYIVIGLIPVFIGLMGPQLPFQFEHKDQFLPTLAQQMFPPFLFVVFLGALIAAILSTVDSTLLTVSAFVTHNVMGERFYGANEKKKLFYSKLIVVLTGIVALILAYEAKGIYELVSLASSFGTSGVLVLTLTAIWKPSWAKTLPAWICLIAGMISFPIAGRVLDLEAPFLISIAAALLAYFIPLLFFSMKPRLIEK